MTTIAAIIPALRRRTALNAPTHCRITQRNRTEPEPVRPQGENFQNVSHKVYTT
jgi:hypothetical protein